VYICIQMQTLNMHTSRGSISYIFVLSLLPISLQIHMSSSNTKKGEIEWAFTYNCVLVFVNNIWWLNHAPKFCRPSRLIPCFAGVLSKRGKDQSTKNSFCVYPFKTPYYQEGHSADGVGEFLRCTKPYAPTSHPICLMVESTPRICATAISRAKTPVWKCSLCTDTLPASKVRLSSRARIRPEIPA
jgi:hypothetical protein